MKSPKPEEIKKLRESLGLTVREAAEKIGRTRRAWYYYEGGEVEMPGNMWRLFQLETQRRGKK